MKICVPLLGKSKEEILYEIQMLRNDAPDFYEWRVDYFKNIHELDQVIDTLTCIKNEIGNKSLIITVRHENEGGKTKFEEKYRYELLKACLSTGLCDYFDIELNSNENIIRFLANEKSQSKMILSYHDFEKTPMENELVSIYKKGESRGADLVKIAVMPKCTNDVLTLLKVSQWSSDSIKSDSIAISMGKLGLVSRIFGHQFGSKFTFASMNETSAPGQISISDLREIQKRIK